MTELKGGDGERRIRVGEWRVIYNVTDDLVEVLVIAPRGRAYR